MTNYTAPVADLTFACTELADLAGVDALPGIADASPELLSAILEEAGRFASEVLAPLNQAGDQQGVRLENGRTLTADGWKEAYRQFIDGGWNGLPFSEEFGGQGLPWVIATATSEIWESANMAFTLCPLLTQGAIEAVLAHGSESQRETYLGKLVSGEWTGTMNLTEPQAGSDLAAVRSRAVPQGDHYLITGQKIFITYGDHDMTDNIVHLVLARTPNAPEGVKGISLFIVPKYLPDDEGSWTVPNDVETLSLEHKLGIHASPTAVLGYGNNGGAVGYLVGEENQGLTYMFTMMNVARHSVGVQGYAVAERAYQQAVQFASERVHGKAIDDPAGERVAIIRHPDIQRLLWTQKCRNEALRALGLVAASCMDKANRHPDEEMRSAASDMVEVLTPIVKGYSTEIGLENVSLALQVHGGMGFIEETGAAQFYRDQRITPIYEGTTGIQALDLTGRKLLRDGGRMTLRVIDFIRQDVAGYTSISDEMAATMGDALNSLADMANTLLSRSTTSVREVAAVAEPYLRLWGVVSCGWLMAKAAHRAGCLLDEGSIDDRFDATFLRTKIRCAEFYFASEMPRVSALVSRIGRSGELVAGGHVEDFQVR
jgi:alkylation response protein AidB-like acyl-CoA dehydrogenase